MMMETGMRRAYTYSVSLNYLLEFLSLCLNDICCFRSHVILKVLVKCCCVISNFSFIYLHILLSPHLFSGCCNREISAKIKSAKFNSFVHLRHPMYYSLIQPWCIIIVFKTLIQYIDSDDWWNCCFLCVKLGLTQIFRICLENLVLMTDCSGRSTLWYLQCQINQESSADSIFLKFYPPQ